MLIIVTTVFFFKTFLLFAYLASKEASIARRLHKLTEALKANTHTKQYGDLLTKPALSDAVFCKRVYQLLALAYACFTLLALVMFFIKPVL